VGTVYANLFPNRLRGAVLDGGYDPHAYANQPYRYDLGQYVAVDAALTRFLRWCGENPTVCPLGAGDPAGAYDRLIDRLDQRPIIAHASDGTTVTVNGVFMLYQTLLALNSGRAFWPTLGVLLTLADAGAGPLVSGELPPTLIPLLTVNIAVECADRAFPTDRRVLRAALAAESLAGGRFGALAYGPPAYDQAHATACVPWPAMRKSRYTGPFTAAGAPPILVVGTTGDPDTPYQDAVTLSKTLAGARLITLAGEGHTAYGRSACVTAAVATYLTDLTLPPAGTVCEDEGT
jgi:pimeloyl-ACP methyl ester carboxylesterase